MLVMARLCFPSVKESMDEHSTPKSATTSPALTSLTSSISSLCMRTRRGTLIFFPVFTLTSHSPFFTVPWYTRM